MQQSIDVIPSRFPMKLLKLFQLCLEVKSSDVDYSQPSKAPLRMPSAKCLRRCLIIAIISRSFYPHLNTLLNEENLLGRGYLAQTELRSLGYNALAELIHHVRAELDYRDLSRIVCIFSRSDSLAPKLLACLSLQRDMQVISTVKARKTFDKGCLFRKVS